MPVALCAAVYNLEFYNKSGEVILMIENYAAPTPTQSHCMATDTVEFSQSWVYDAFGKRLEYTDYGDNDYS